MSTTKEELHKLVELLSAENAERVLNLLKSTADHTPPKTDEADYGRDWFRRHLRQIGDRIGLDVDRLPQNGGCSGGESEGKIELTKDWESEDARHRLSQLHAFGREIILLERITENAGRELRYEVRVFTEESEGRAELSVPGR